jgi:hypothetical protein
MGRNFPKLPLLAKVIWICVQIVIIYMLVAIGRTPEVELEADVWQLSNQGNKGVYWSVYD